MLSTSGSAIAAAAPTSRDFDEGDSDDPLPNIPHIVHLSAVDWRMISGMSLYQVQGGEAIAVGDTLYIADA